MTHQTFSRVYPLTRQRKPARSNDVTSLGQQFFLKDVRSNVFGLFSRWALRRLDLTQNVERTPSIYFLCQTLRFTSLGLFPYTTDFRVCHHLMCNPGSTHTRSLQPPRACCHNHTSLRANDPQNLLNTCAVIYKFLGWNSNGSM